MPWGTSADAYLAPAIKTTYDRQLLERALPNLVFARYGIPKNIPARGGTSIEIRKLGSIPVSTTALAEGSLPAAEASAAFATITLSISQYGQYTQFSDIVETQSYDDVLGEFVEVFGENMGQTLDIIVRNAVWSGITSDQYAGAAISDASLQATIATESNYYIDSAEIMEAANTLKRNNIAPLMDGKYVLVVHPDSVLDLYGDSNIVTAFQQAANRGGDNPLFTGVLGDYMGVRFVETTHAPSLYCSTSNVMDYVYSSILIGKGAYAVTKLDSMSAKIIIHPRGTGGHADPLETVSQIGWKAAIVAGVLDVNAIVDIHHITSTSAMNA